LVQVAGLQAGLPRSVARRLALRLQQLGVVAVAETPEHFAVLSELIRRHLLRPPSSAADHAQAAAGANPRAGSA
jgi:hypothetical protein